MNLERSEGMDFEEAEVRERVNLLRSEGMDFEGEETGDNGDVEGGESSAFGDSSFLANTGPTTNLSSKEPIEVFDELFTHEITNKILVETNRYANQYIDSHEEYLELHPRARAHDFVRTPFSIVEIYK